MIKIDLKEISEAPDDWSEVFDYQEDIEKIEEIISKIVPDNMNVISVGNGGSITSIDAYSHALKSNKSAVSVWTMDEFYLSKVKEKYSPSDSIVVAVSKSGNTLGQIESLMFFKEYKVICVTNPNEGTLSKIAKQMNWNIIEHPAIGGRFSGGTSSAFVPAIIAGLNAKKIQEGLLAGYKMKNEAFSLAKFYHEKELEGFSEVYITCYCEALAGFENLIVQLMHESVCKEENGQTFYFSMGPEAQHHTNQRFLGGKKNVIGTFIIEEPKDGIKIELSEKIKSIDYKGSNLSLIDQLNYSFALNAEYLGTKGDAEEQNIPCATLSIKEINEASVGMLTSFWHLVAFYSSILRNVNPFDQPAVERSKNITLEIIKQDK